MKSLPLGIESPKFAFSSPCLFPLVVPTPMCMSWLVFRGQILKIEDDSFDFIICIQLKKMSILLDELYILII